LSEKKSATITDIMNFPVRSYFLSELCTCEHCLFSWLLFGCQYHYN